MVRENIVNRTNFMIENKSMIDYMHTKRDQLMKLPHNELTVLWFSHEHQTLQDYGLEWYSGMDFSPGGGGGWACISNSTNRGNFQMWADHSDYIAGGFRKEYWEIIAVILANQENITIIPTLPVSDIIPENNSTPLLSL